MQPNSQVSSEVKGDWKTLESLSADGDVSTAETARLHSGFAVLYPSAVSQYGKFAVFHPSDFHTFVF